MKKTYTSKPDGHKPAPELNSEAVQPDDRMNLRRFMFLLGIFVLACAAFWFYASKTTAQFNEEFQISKLPPGMPRFVKYPRNIFLIETTNTEDYTYTVEGSDDPGKEHAGKMYTIEGTSELMPGEIKEFYNSFLMDKGFRQRINISLPSGHRVDYENDRNIFSLEVERKSSDPKTRVKIIVYD